MKRLLFVLLLVAMLNVPSPRDVLADTIYLPVVTNGEDTRCYLVESKPLNLYCSPMHFAVSGNMHVFTSSTYYGYFMRSNNVKNIDTGTIYARVISIEAIPQDEQRVLAAFGGKLVFIQRLKTKTKITIFE